MKELNTYHEHSEDPKLPSSLRVNPFTVPENYFQEARSITLSGLKLHNIKTFNAFTIPDSYFEILAENIKAQTTTLPFPTANNGMEIPDKYFEDLPVLISGRLAEANLKEGVSNTGFTVPQDYFEQTEKQLNSQIKIEKFRLSPETDVFRVETAYFETLSTRILKRVKEEDSFVHQPEVRDNIRKISDTKRWRRILAAASIVAILSFGVFFGISQDDTSVQSSFVSEDVSLKDIPDEDLANYLAMNNDGLDYLVEYITLDDATSDELPMRDFVDQDLEEYIKLMME